MYMSISRVYIKREKLNKGDFPDLKINRLSDGRVYVRGPKSRVDE